MHKSDDNSTPPGLPPFSINQINHVVVIYQENWSFDALFGQYPGANGMRFNTPLTQVDNTGAAVATMPPPTNASYAPFTSTLYANPTMPVQFYNLADFNGNGAGGGTPWADANTITNDITHRFIHEQLQIDGGAMDEHVFWSDTSSSQTPGPNPPSGGALANNYPAGGNMNALSTSGVDCIALGLPTAQLALQYVLCDNCFQSAFGGSFLNHQFLVAAQAPIWPGNATKPLLTGSVLTFPAYPIPASLQDVPLTPANAVSTNADGSTTPNTYPVTFASDPGPGGGTGASATPITAAPGNWDLVCLEGGLYAPLPPGSANGDRYAVNTVQPPFPPTSGSTAGGKYLPPQTHATIAIRLDGASVSWKWYAEAWNELNTAYTPGNLTAAASTVNVPSINFQFHHQPFNYFAAFDPTPGSPTLTYRNAHLQDLDNIYTDLAAGNLPAVSFVKFSGDDNEHPGYASLMRSETAVYNLVKAIQASANWKDTAIIITYDEFGGHYDHVTPPVGDHFGPGHRIPMVIVSPFAKFRFIDHTLYETCSILSFIEHRWNLAPLAAHDANAAYFLLPFMNTLSGNG